MRYALGQLNTTVGDVDGNFQVVSSLIAQAEQAQVELIIFPELTLTGYPPRDLVYNKDILEANLKALDRLLPLSKKIGILIGHIANNTRYGEKPLYNSASLLFEGKTCGTYHKQLLPNYDVFDETRYFAPGTKLGYFEFKGTKLGVTICEDIWNDKAFWDEPRYSYDPVAEVMDREVDMLINLSASPYAQEKQAMRLDMTASLAKQYRVPVIFCNQVGGNDDLIFDGHSHVVNQQGGLIGEAKKFESDLLIIDADNQSSTESACEIDELENIYRALCLGVKDYTHKCGFDGVVLGLSGGVDSALTAALAVEALGAEHVVGFIMPSRFTSPESIEDADELARLLSIKTHQVSIEPLYSEYLSIFAKLFPGQAQDTTEENIQARIRGNLMMAFSNKEGHLLLSTGNKSEIAVGYCTLYGDMSGGLSVIADLPKTLVYKLCEWINRRSLSIPNRILTKAPSAELRPNQTDQDSLPDYDVLDAILQDYVEDHLTAEEIIGKGRDAEAVHQVVRMIITNEYKRYQMPLGLKVSKKAFGQGRRYPLAKKV